MPAVDLARTRPVFERHPWVVAAWAFGSSRYGEVRDGSDVDLAVLCDPLPALDARADLRADLQDALGFDDIDLLIVNDASPVARMEALSGRPLFCRDIQARAAFASLSAREYEDEMAFAAKGLGRPTCEPAPGAGARPGAAGRNRSSQRWAVVSSKGTPDGRRNGRE